MPAPLEAFLADIYIAGSFEGTPAELHQLLDAGSVVELRDMSFLRLADFERGKPDRLAAGTVVPDEVFLVATTEDPDVPTIHHVKHTVEVWLGPYQVAGEMALLPGFDPGRALMRPTTAFVVLRDAQVRITTPSGTVDQAYEHLLVNRYAVERVSSEIELSFWFPGAEQEPTPAA